MKGLVLDMEQENSKQFTIIDALDINTVVYSTVHLFLLKIVYGYCK